MVFSPPNALARKRSATAASRLAKRRRLILPYARAGIPGVRFEGLCALIQNALFRPASAGGELCRRKIVLEPGIISSGWIGTEATFPSTSCTSWPKPYGGLLIPMATATLSASRRTARSGRSRESLPGFPTRQVRPARTQPPIAGVGPRS